MLVPALPPGDAGIIRRRRLVRAVRLLVWLALGLALFRAAWRVRFGLPQTPLADEDVWGYLYPPLCKLTGGGFIHVFSREWLYPGFLFVILCLSNAFDVIATVQHGLGLLTGGLLLVAWAEFVRLAPRAGSFVRRETQAWAEGLAGLGLAAVWLLARRSVLTEHTLRPEAVFPFFGALHLWFILGFVRRRWTLGQARKAVCWGAGAVFVTGVLLLLRPAFGFAAILANAPVAVALLARGEPWQWKARLVGLPLALAALLLFVPEWMLARADRSSTTLMPAMRVAVHADLVRAQIDADLAQPGNPPRFDRAWLQTLKARLDVSFEHSARPENRWPALGFNGDYLVAVEPFYAGSFPDTEEGDRRLAEFCNHYYFQVWRQQPRAMLAKVGRELRRFYFFNPKRLITRRLRHTVDPYTELEKPPLTATPYYPRTVRSLDVPSLRERMGRSDAFKTHLVKCQQLAASSSARVIQPKMVGITENLVRATYLPVLALAMVVAAVRLRQPRPEQAAATGVLFGYNLGMCLTVAIVQTLSTTRYVENQQVFTLFAWASGLWLVAAAGIHAAHRRLAPIRGDVPAPSQVATPVTPPPETPGTTPSAPAARTGRKSSCFP